MKKKILFYSISVLFSCGFYSFRGTSIDPEIKKIKISYFLNVSENIKANLDRDLTNNLTDLILNQTKLIVSENDYDIKISGKITRYEIKPISISANDQANQNRVSVSVEVNFENLLNKKDNYVSNFTRYADYDSNQNLVDVEESLLSRIVEEICEDIFNKTFVNW